MIHFFFQAKDGIRDIGVTGVQTCALPIWTSATAMVIPQPLSALTSSTSTERRLRKIETMIASPTTTSAAATVITKKAITCPDRTLRARAKDAKERLAALSISSIDIKTTSGFLRTSTPTTPIVKRAALRMKYHHSGAINASSDERRATSDERSPAASC